MKYQCDTAKDCGWPNCGRQRHHGYHSGPVGCDQWYNCKHAGHRVRCNPIEEPRETHTCTVTDEWTPGKRQVTVRCSQLSEAEICLQNGMPCSVATDGIACAFHHPEIHAEVHACYFCDHTGTDVNRIAAVMPPMEYCCQDAVACDERWQALDQEDSLEEQIESIIVEEILNEAPNWNVPPLLTLSGNAGGRATARIMELIELPF